VRRLKDVTALVEEIIGRIDRLAADEESRSD